MSIRKIAEEINKRSTFSEVSVEDFAPDGKWASNIASELKDKMKTNQLRKVFHELKRMELQHKGKDDGDAFKDPKVYLLIPQLAYAKARKLITDDFYDLAKSVIGDKEKTKLRTVGDYRRFVEFMTAIVAYHKQ